MNDLSTVEIMQNDNKRSKKRKKKTNPLNKIRIELTGLHINDDDDFIFIPFKADIIEQIVQCVRLELIENQILKTLKLRRHEYLAEVHNNFKNINHMYCLVNLVPSNIKEYSEMQVFWGKLRNEIEKEIEQGLKIEEIAKRRCVETEEMYKYIRMEFGEIDSIYNKQHDKGNIEGNQKKGIDMKDYIQLFGFNGLNFDFKNIDSNIKQYIPTMEFEEFISKYNYTGIKDIVYIRKQLLGVYKESRPFYPAEDIILMNYYNKVGYRVVEILESVLPNYKVRELQEYEDRIRILKNVKVHPKNSFGITEEDKRIIRILCEKDVPLTNNKYMPWMNTAEIQYYAFKLGYTTKKPIKEYEEIDIEHIDIAPYIELASKLREVKYHCDKWTTERHEYFKEGYKEKGIDIADEIDWVTKSECILRAKQFSIKQRYTEEETNRIKEVFIKEGWEGLRREFPNRTDKALKYKIEEMGLLTITNSVVSEDQIESIKADLIDEIREEERIKLRQEMKKEIQREVEKELTPILESRIRKNVEYTLRKELTPKIKEAEITRINKELDKFIDNILDVSLRFTITEALNRIPPKEYGSKLIEEIYNSIVTNITKEISKIK